MARWTNPNTWEFKVSAFGPAKERKRDVESLCHRMLAGLESAGSYLMRFSLRQR